MGEFSYCVVRLQRGHTVKKCGVPGETKQANLFLMLCVYLISYNSHHDSRAQSRETVPAPRFSLWRVCVRLGKLQREKKRGVPGETKQARYYEQALVSLKVKETVNAEGWCTKAVVIEGG